MTDRERVYPSSANGGAAPAAANGGPSLAVPPNKAHPYNAARPVYRPKAPPRRSHRRGCCCSCCLCTTLFIFIILLLAAIAGAVFYALYRPHRPSFTVASLSLSEFNLTDTAVTSAFNVTITARNTNSEIAFFYDQISVKIISGEIGIGDGIFPGFTLSKKNATNLRAIVSSANYVFPDGTDISSLKSSFNSRNLPVKIQMETKVKTKIGKIETKKLKIRVYCNGINIGIPNGKTASVAAISNLKCKVDPRIKIFKWTI
ncbi:hypothetical protein ACP275_04G097600 [Erythranthe tilingii]